MWHGGFARESFPRLENGGLRLRARAGVAFDSTLLYVAGGLAMAGITVNDMDSGRGKDDSIHFGWTVGAGVEQMLTQHLSIRCEYLYDNYGPRSYTINKPEYFGGDYKAKTELSSQTVRIGLAYCF